MQKNPVSVIVAIYNAEKTLPRLIDSLKAQTMPDFEVLLIDDGSTDASGSICDGIAQSDNRFKAFHKQNEGIGSTRQFGIDHASGEYTIHADADDWVEPDYLELLYHEAISSDADMVICDLIEESGKQIRYNKQEIKAYQGKELALEIMRLHGGPCNKLIKRSAYQDAGIKYVDGLNYGEDQIFNIELILSGIKASYIPKALYHYDIGTNMDSAVRGISLDKIQHREKYISTLRSILPDEFETSIDNKHLEVVYMAILSKQYSKKQFLANYSFLSRVKWKDYYNKAFFIKLIIWTSLNISYRLALFMSGIKNFVRRMRQ